MTKDDREIVSAVHRALVGKVGQERFAVWFGRGVRMEPCGTTLRIAARTMRPHCNISAFILWMVILCGMGNVWGVMFGAAFLAYLNQEGLANIGHSLNQTFGTHLEVPLYQFGIYGVIIVLMMMFRPQGLIPEARRKREIEEGTRGALDEPIYEMRGADEPGAGERGSPGAVPRG